VAEVREPDLTLARRLRSALASEGVELVGQGAALGARSVVLWSLPPTVDGLDRLGRAHPRVRALVLVDDPSGRTVGSFLEAGAKAVTDRRADVATIVGAAVAVARGYLVLPSDGRRALLPSHQVGGLTDEHVGWLRALDEGLAVAGLAERVGCSEREMYRRLRQIYDLLRVPGRDEAFRLLSRAALLGTPTVRQ
jgi:DNA-binding NarL/FixJ family response regulator